MLDGIRMKDDVNILIVEDDLFTAKNIQKKVEKMGFKHSELALTYQKAIEILKKRKFDLILLDVNLENGYTGMDIAHEKKVWHKIPVIYITGCKDAQTKKEILNSIYHSYLCKPLRYDELEMAIASALQVKEASLIIKLGHYFHYEKETKILFQDEEIIKLSKNETSLLESLIQTNGGVCPIKELEFAVWGYEPPSTSSLRTLIGSLRKKLNPKMIVNVPSLGYQLVIN